MAKRLVSKTSPVGLNPTRPAMKDAYNTKLKLNDLVVASTDHAVRLGEVIKLWRRRLPKYCKPRKYETVASIRYKDKSVGIFSNPNSLIVIRKWKTLNDIFRK